MSIPVSLLSGGLLGLLLVGLGLRVPFIRATRKISLGDGGDKELARFIRLHGNNVEHVPLFLALCLSYELAAGSTTALWYAAGLFVFARLLYSWGMWMRSFTRQRQIGATLSLLVELFLSGALIGAAIAHLK